MGHVCTPDQRSEFTLVVRRTFLCVVPIDSSEYTVFLPRCNRGHWDRESESFIETVEREANVCALRLPRHRRDLRLCAIGLSPNEVATAGRHWSQTIKQQRIRSSATNILNSNQAELAVSYAGAAPTPLTPPTPPTTARAQTIPARTSLEAVGPRPVDASL